MCPGPPHDACEADGCCYASAITCAAELDLVLWIGDRETSVSDGVAAWQCTPVYSHAPQAGQLGAALQEELQPLPQRLQHFSPSQSQEEQLLRVRHLAGKHYVSLYHALTGLQSHVQAQLFSGTVTEELLIQVLRQGCKLRMPCACASTSSL